MPLVGGARGARAVRHHHHALRRHLLRLARRQSYRPRRHCHRRCHRHLAADRRPGCAPGMVGLHRPGLGQRMECRPGQPLRSGRWRLALLETAGRPAPRLRDLCRRARRYLAERFRRQRDPALRSRHGDLHQLRLRQKRRQRAPDAGAAGRGLGGRIGHRSTGGDPQRGRSLRHGVVIRLARLTVSWQPRFRAANRAPARRSSGSSRPRLRRRADGSGSEHAPHRFGKKMAPAIAVICGVDRAIRQPSHRLLSCHHGVLHPFPVIKNWHPREKGSWCGSGQKTLTGSLICRRQSLENSSARPALAGDRRQADN